MREFTHVIYMGGGIHSAAHSYDLHKHLEKALSILSGLQQPNHGDSQDYVFQSERYRRIQELELEDILTDIVVALGGECMLKKQKGKE